MKRLTAGPLIYEFSRHVEPRLRIAPGETIAVESEDAFSGQIRTADDRRDKQTMPFSNPQTGPIWVEGAEPGDVLAVTNRVDRADHGPLRHPHQRSRPTGANGWARIVPTARTSARFAIGQILWSDEITIPYAPMLGCIGTAPAWGVPTTLPAGPHGGNMDILETALAAPYICRCGSTAAISTWATRMPRWATASCRPAAWKCPR